MQTIPEFLQARAKKLGACIVVQKRWDDPPGRHIGPFVLCCRETGEPIFMGLPLEGLADALNCFEREHRLMMDVETEQQWAGGIGWYEVIVDEARWNAVTQKAWRDFGARWLL
jgi:hypothetical protein